MNDEHNDFSGEPSRPPAGSGSHGDQSSSAPDYSQDEGESPKPSDLQRMENDVQGTRPLNEDVDPEIIDAQPVTHGEIRHILSEFWAGPTPSPNTLEQFNKVDPSFAARAFAMSEQTVSASNHERIALVDGDVAAVRRGQWMSFGLTISFVGASLIIYFLDGNAVLSAAFLTPPAFQYLGKLIRTVRNAEKDQIE